MKVSLIATTVLLGLVAGWIVKSSGTAKSLPAPVRSRGDPITRGPSSILTAPASVVARNGVIPGRVDKLEKINRLNVSGVDTRIRAFGPNGRISDQLASFLELDEPRAVLLTQALVGAERQVLDLIARDETVSAAASDTLTVEFPALPSEESAMLMEQWRQGVLAVIDPERLDLLLAVAGDELFSKAARFGARQRMAQVRFRTDPVSGEVLLDVDETVLNEEGQKTEMRGARANIGSENMGVLVESFPWVPRVVSSNLEKLRARTNEP